MGAAAGKQFQSEKAKHAEAVLNAVQVFEESNEQDEDSYRGSISTEFFKKKVRLAASDAKSKGKDIEKSLAQLTDADLDMLAHYAENRKDEERRLAGTNLSTMQVEEIVDDEELNTTDKGATDNIDETTSVLSYGDDEEEAADHDDLDSSDELIENIEETTTEPMRPRANSGYKVFPMDAKSEENAPKLSLKTPDKGKLKLDEATVRPGIADHFAKFWDLEDATPTPAPTHAGSNGTDSPLTGVNTPNKKYQSPKPAFPYKDRGQRIDERNEALMVLQRQKVISLTQNAQLEREVEALQRQLEKMDQIEQTFETSRFGGTGNSSLSNTATSVHSNNNNPHSNSNSGTISHNNSANLYPYGHNDFMSSSGHHGNSNNNPSNTHGKHSYIYPIDEEISQSNDHMDAASGKSSKLHSHYTNNLNAHNTHNAHKKSESKSAVVTGGSASVAHSRRVRRDRGNKHSSPSSSDNDSINSFSKNNTGLSSKAQGKHNIVRVRSNDPSDLSDDYSSNNNNPHATSNTSNAGVINVGGNVGGNGKGSRRVRGVVQDSDGEENSGRHSGYNPSSHGAVRTVAARPSNTTTTTAGSSSSAAHNSNTEDHKHSDSDAETSLRANKAQPLKIQSRRIVGVSVKPTINTAAAHDEATSKRLSDSDHEHSNGPSNHSSGIRAGAGGSVVATGLNNLGSSPKVSRARQLQVMQQNAANSSGGNGGSHGGSSNGGNGAFFDAKQSSPVRVHKEDQASSLYVHSTHSTQHSSPMGSGVTDPSDKKYRALMDNVSLHLNQHQHQEASQKEQKEQKEKDSAEQHTANTTSTSGGGGNGSGSGSVVLTASKLPVRNTKGGALKKLNRRRHSMDGLNEDADTSQDEAYKKYHHSQLHPNNVHSTPSHATNTTHTNATDRSPPHAHMNVHGVSVGIGREGSVLGREGRESNVGVNYVTTDDESVGQGSPNRNKVRRPRAKLQVLAREGSTVGSNVGGSGVGNGVDGDGVSTGHTHGLPNLTPDRHKPTAHNTPTHSTPTHSTPTHTNTAHTTNATHTPVHSTPTAEAPSDGESSITNANANNTSTTNTTSTSNTKPKRRTRATGKQKSEASLNTHSTHHSNANGSGAGGEAAAPTGPWDSTLDQWWAEISLLLRKPILQEEDMLYTVAAAEAGLMYTEEMNSIAKTLNVLRGALSRWILPYDNNTRIDSQCSTPHSVVENMPEEFRGKLTERQVHYLVAGANGVRKLVRVKIADDNDLEQARKALKSTDMFFKALYHRAGEANLTPYNLLLLAEKYSYA